MVRDKRKYADRAEYLKMAVDRRRKQIRKMAIEYKGSQCKICSYSKCEQALEFHHLDKAKKDFSISAKGYTRSWKVVKKELDKCILLCANCHREIHDGITQLPTVTLVENEVNSGKPEMVIPSQAPILLGKV